jgi:hypothetical protein
MKNYLKFMAWWCSGFTLKDGNFRMFFYLVLAVFGAMAFGYEQYWLIALLVAIVLELGCSMVSYMYNKYEREMNGTKKS